MFRNIGKKLKRVALVIFVVEAVISAIVGIMLISDEIWWGFVVMFGGAGAAWLGSIGLYGFGQLVDNSDQIVQILRDHFGESDHTISPDVICMFFCPACRKIMVGREGKNVMCSDCGTQMLETDITADAWRRLSDEGKSIMIQSLEKGRHVKNITYSI